jgi:predicted RNA binding protein YcfA (HicA-like mRNA interferase family)
MSERIRRLTAREVERILSRHGFLLVSQRGSHRKWRHPELHRQVVVPEHRNRPLPIGTIKSIMTGANLPPNAWKSQ